MLLKMGVRICPSFWYQMALSRVLAHGLQRVTLNSQPSCSRDFSYLLLPGNPLKSVARNIQPQKAAFLCCRKVVDSGSFYLGSN